MDARRSTLSVSLLALTCAALAGVLALELLDPPRLARPSAAGPKQSPEWADPEVEPPQVLAIDPLSQYSEIVERPLFLSDRRPPPEEPQSVAEPEPEEETEFTLLGVVLTPERNAALLQLDEPGKVARLAVGESVNGWKLVSALPESVTLHKGEAVLSLVLVRNKPVPAVAPRPRAGSRNRRAAERIEQLRSNLQGEARENPPEESEGNHQPESG